MKHITEPDLPEMKPSITLEEGFASIAKTFRYILRYWYVPIAGGILIAAAMAYKAYMTKPVYRANLTFMVNEDESSKIGGGALALLGRFGSVGGKLNLQKILELSKSNIILKTALFQKDTVGNKLDFYANHLLDIYDLHKKDENTVRFKDADFEHFTLDENRTLKEVMDLLTGQNALLQTSFNDKSGIMTLSLYTENQSLTIGLLKTIYQELGDFYITKSIEKEQYTYDIIKQRSDSLYRVMNRKGLSRAASQDKILGAWQATSQVPSENLYRDSRIATELYSETVKNLELADISLKTKMPFMQSIDVPYPPIEPEIQSWKKKALLGMLIGLLLGSIMMIVRNIFGDVIRFK